jgi:hypothetical protein
VRKYNETQHMLATSEALEDAQARLAPYAVDLLGEFGRGGVVCVRRAGLRFEMLNRPRFRMWSALCGRGRR